MGGAVSAGETNDELVDNLVEAEYVRTAAIERALRFVDRGDYYLQDQRETAYKDLAWKFGNLHLSAPCIYAEVLESLQIEPGQSFLNLGSGTGYLSTIVGLLLEGSGLNDGVELHVDVVEYARERVQQFVERSAAVDFCQFTPPNFTVGNCLNLDAAAVQYDRVYCGAAVDELQRDFINNLVKVGGVVVMPCGDQLLHIRRTAADKFEERSVLAVSFASLVAPSACESLPAATALPVRQPPLLQELCRRRVRAAVRNGLHQQLPDTRQRCVVVERPERSPNGSQETAERPRRIVIPVYRPPSEEDEANDGDRGGDRRRVRGQVVTIDRGGRFLVDDVQLSRLIFGQGRAVPPAEDDSDASDSDNDGSGAAPDEETGEASADAADSTDERKGMLAKEHEDAESSAVDTHATDRPEKGAASRSARFSAASKRTLSETSTASTASSTRARKRRPRMSSACDDGYDMEEDGSADGRAEAQARAEQVHEQMSQFSTRMRALILSLPVPFNIRVFLNLGRSE